MKFVFIIAAILCVALASGCAVTPAVVPTCAVAAIPEAPPRAAPPAVAPLVAPAAPPPVYVKPVVPPLPVDVYQPSTPRALVPKPVFYGADMVEAMVQTVPATALFMAGGDTYFWHKDPRGHRERVFYGHGDRRAEVAQRRTAARSRVADSTNTNIAK